MPQVLESSASPDWTYVQTLYLQGKTPKEIEAITGIPKQSVSVRASRLGWTASLRKAKPVLQVSIQTGEEKPDNQLAKSSQAVRTGLAGVLERSIEQLEHLSFKTPKAALKANVELESVVRNAKVVFGWSDSSSQPAVRISIMGSAVIQEEAKAQSPVIDVDSSQVLPSE